MNRQKNPTETRKTILQAAFERTHKYGFQAAGLNEILMTTGVTKGALYHHFPNKMALGYALVDEMLRGYVDDWWLGPMEAADDPIEAFAQLIQTRMSSDLPNIVRLGCPLNNLSQEMSAVDEGFRQRIEAIFRHWRKGLARAFRRGQQNGSVRGDVDSEETAAFVIASLMGAFGQAKSAQSIEVFQACLGGLSVYLTALRP